MPLAAWVGMLYFTMEEDLQYLQNLQELHNITAQAPEDPEPPPGKRKERQGRRQRIRRKRRWWVRDWIQKRQDTEQQNTLFKLKSELIAVSMYFFLKYITKIIIYCL